MKKLAYTSICITPIIYLNHALYYKAYGMQRALVSLYFEAKIFVNYKIHGFNDKSHKYCSSTLAALFFKNKGSAIKLGQNLAQHHHVLPKSFIEDMEPFLQASPVTPFNQVQKLIEKETKKDLFEIFDYFEEDPIASASIGQVHKAKLKGKNEFVAVKVQHPTIKELVKADIEIVNISCKLAEYFFPVKCNWISKDFSTNMTKEVNFKREAKNIIKARKLFKGNNYVIVPYVHKDLCTDRMLVMSFEEGKSITDKEYRIKNNIKVEDISSLLTHTFYKQIFDYGFVHADPHAGNLFIRKEQLSKHNKRIVTKLVLLDHGLYIKLDEKFIKGYSYLWRGIFKQDKNIIKEGCEQLGIRNSEVFTTMLTGRDFKEVMDTTKKYNTEERLKIKKIEHEKVHKWMNKNFKEMFNVFEEGPVELPLLLKITDYLRSIDSKIGTPLNNYVVLVSFYKIYLIYIFFFIIIIMFSFLMYIERFIKIINYQIKEYLVNLVYHLNIGN